MFPRFPDWMGYAAGFCMIVGAVVVGSVAIGLVIRVVTAAVRGW